MSGELLTRWTVRLALAGYFTTLCILIARPKSRGATHNARVIWTVGCLLFLAHVALAFHVFHHWSHADAYRETAEQSAELTGVAAGWGIYLNYLFAAAWMTDSLMWWWGGTGFVSRRPRWANVALHAFMLFMVVNGAIVFEAGVSRWIAIAGCAAAFLTWMVTRLVTRPN